MSNDRLEHFTGVGYIVHMVKNDQQSHGDISAILKTAFADIAPRGLVSVYLYGSWAGGRDHRESDVDVGILLDWETFPTSRERFEMRVYLSSRLEESLGGQKADVVVLNDAPPELGRRIVTTGIRLSCTNSEIDHAFIRDVQLLAADLEPFLRRTRRIKLEALTRRP